jgi:hypothetical protein
MAANMQHMMMPQGPPQQQQQRRNGPIPIQLQNVIYQNLLSSPQPTGGWQQTVQVTERMAKLAHL